MSNSNFLRAYEREMAKYTDAPDVFHAATASTLLAAALTRADYRCLLAGGTPARWMNLWTFLVGDSGESRKSTAVNMGVEVLMRAMPEMRAPDDGSPEGFGKDFVDKERTQKGDASAILVQDEMGLFLMNMQKDYMKSMKGMLMAFYDVPPIYKKQLSREQFTVRKPRLSMLGGVALELLPNLTSSEDWLGGFMGRALIIFAGRTRTQERAATVPEVTYRGLSNQLLSTVREWQRTRKRQQKLLPKDGDQKTFLFDYDDEALKAARVLRKSLKETLDDGVKILRARGDVHLMKLAAAEQIAMDPSSPVITKKAVDNAFPLYKHWWDHAPEVMEMAFARSNADTEGDRLARRLLRAVRNRPHGIPELELMRGIVLDWDLFQNALNSLEMAKLVERFDAGDGSPTLVKMVC